MLEKNPQVETIKINKLNPHNWVDRYADYLYNYALLRINDDELAKDLVQETFLAALETKEKFQGRSTEKTWLTSILKNKVVDFYRSKAKGYTSEINLLEAQPNGTDFFNLQDGHWNDWHRPSAMGIEQPSAIENKEFEHILQACMKKLPILWLAVFSRKHLEEQRTDTICSELKLSPSNFWVIIHRTKLNLRSCLEKNWI